MSYKISQYTFSKAKLIDVDVKSSIDKSKKIDVFKNGLKLCSIGSIKHMGYTMYLQNTDKTNAEKRRLLYHQRHKKDISVKYSPG